MNGNTYVASEQIARYIEDSVEREIQMEEIE